ncbi:LysR substrate-binding domain-containing protein (plasmid) [Pseudomonas aeruginosa]|uniref:LysR substrate-binding domain-containing protein n=1 Tax=Pseudomonas aeruginosa TaxID=287 RepID=UPI00208F1E23|nr:LysR substrate-binding domain-containing protein [Pseudomonas aeruginosa]
MKFYQDVSPLLAAMSVAVQRVQRGLSRSTPLITIAANFGFLHLWLLPRLPDLQREFPGVRFTLVPADPNDSEASRDADIYITFDRYNSTAGNEILLVQEVVFPVCSPDFAAANQLGERLTREDLERCALLHMDKQNPRWLDWTNWAIQAGYGPLHQGSSFTFNNYPLLLNAALQGQGLTLAWGTLVDTAINQGLLIAMQPAVVRPDHGYLLRSRNANTALVRPVIEWFQRSLANDQPQ